MYHKEKLVNGLNLITVPIKNTRAVSILVLVPVGSRYETKKINGSTHFIEHMMFKGTKKRPNNFLLSRELDALGAEYNAFTSKDMTAYWIKLDKDYLDKGVEIISDMLFHSLFNEKEFERERGVIIEEIKMYEDNPMMYIDTLFEETVFGNSPLGWPISGRIDDIKNLALQQLLSFKSKFYFLENMLMVVSGDFRKDSLVKLLKGHFLPPAKKSLKKGFKKHSFLSQHAPKLEILNKKSQQVQLAIGFPAYSCHHKNINALTLLSIILGGNMSSRLFSEIRVKRGLAYAIRADLSVYQDTGLFSVQAGVDKNKLDEAIKVILEELVKVKRAGVSREELSRVKTFFAGKLSLDLEDSASMASWYGRQELLIGKTLTPEQKIKMINKINGNVINQVAKDVFRADKLCAAVIGESVDRPRLLSILKAGL